MKQEKSNTTTSKAILAELANATKELSRILRDKEAAVRTPRTPKEK